MLDDNRSLKEQAVEAVLVRWQYSGIEWSLHPTHKATGGGARGGVVDDGDDAMDGAAAGGAGGAIDVEVPPGYVELPGFKGVCVGIREDVLGNIRDVRPTAPRPSKVRQQWGGGRATTFPRPPESHTHIQPPPSPLGRVAVTAAGLPHVAALRRAEGHVAHGAEEPAARAGGARGARAAGWVVGGGGLCA
jgi:hypothetical protein